MGKIFIGIQYLWFKYDTKYTYVNNVSMHEYHSEAHLK